MRKRLFTVALLSLVMLLLAACDQDDFAKRTEQTLAVSQASWEVTQKQVAEAYLDGKLTADQWQTFVSIDAKFRATHNAAVDAFKIYLNARDKPDQIDAAAHYLGVAIANLTTVIGDANNLIAAWGLRAQVKT